MEPQNKIESTKSLRPKPLVQKKLPRLLRQRRPVFYAEACLGLKAEKGRIDKYGK